MQVVINDNTRGSSLDQAHQINQDVSIWYAIYLPSFQYLSRGVRLIMKLTDQQIESLRTYFSTSPVVRAFLFGSMASGRGNAESDVDLLVELDYSKPIGLHFIRMQQELEALLGRSVDLVSTQALSPYISESVLEEKRLVYERPAA